MSSYDWFLKFWFSEIHIWKHAHMKRERMFARWHVFSLLERQKYSKEGFMMNVFWFSTIIATEYLAWFFMEEYFPWILIQQQSLYSCEKYVFGVVFFYFFNLLTATFHCKRVIIVPSPLLLCYFSFQVDDVKSCDEAIVMKKQSVISIWELFMLCANNVLI